MSRVTAGDVFAPSPAAVRRDLDNRVIAGVCAGLGRRMGIDPVILRVAFVVAAAAGGMGLVLYGLAWLLIPADVSDSAGAPARTLPRRASWQVAGGVGLLVLALLLFLRELGVLFSDALVWPVVLAATGTALIWHRSTSARPRTTRLRGLPRPPDPVTRGRVLLGASLVVGAALLFLLWNDALGQARDIVLVLLAVVVALALILTPLWWRLGKSLAEERAARIRSQERAEVGAHLHDSVLQTLALVQRRADDPRAVAALARRQERELRGWLSGTREHGTEASLATALETAAAEVEDRHGVLVEVVAVGDARLDGSGEAVVAATREALVNAAKFAGESPIAVYAEADDAGIRVFVRDRGRGFDPADVPADRRGLRESIVGRMERVGGRAIVRSSSGEGTEVELVVERQ
jgi:signal transduction histidine kinase/phage shock protein PspC (stress-responsive transcriptional regulator)